MGQGKSVDLASALNALPVPAPIQSGSVSAPHRLGRPIPGAIQPAKPVDVTTPKPSNPKASSPETVDLGTTPKSAGKTAAAAGFLAIIAITLATWWHEATAWVSSQF